MHAKGDQEQEERDQAAASEFHESSASHSSLSLLGSLTVLWERERERERYNYKVVRKNKKRMLNIYIWYIHQNLNAFFNSEKEKGSTKKTKKAM